MSIAQADRPRLLADGFWFLEGPRWHEGRLWVSDFFGHRVLTVDEDGGTETVCEVPNQPSGLGFAPDGSVLIVSMLDMSLLRWRGGRPEPVADLSSHVGGVTNDMVVDAAGRAYVGNVGRREEDGTVYPTVLLRVDPDGSVSEVADGLMAPNGTVITPDGGTLIVAETEAERITAFDRSPSGELSGRRTWADFSGLPLPVTARGKRRERVEPDGIALDAEGALWVGDANGRGVLRVKEGGAVVEAIETGELAVYATALGGADGRTLYLCASPPYLPYDSSRPRTGVLLTCRVEVPAAGTE
ncbi:MAG: SMP-30/gluconolactonase/LRE family protein [Solirubrobacterales bacterium]